MTTVLNTMTTTSASNSTTAICPAFVYSNTFAIITSVAGFFGILSCLCVLAVILAYKKDLFFVRERLVAGLTFANLLYSIFCLVPLQFYNLEPRCNSLISYKYQLYLRMLWLGWKFAIVCYEIFFVCFSIYVLRLQSLVQTISVRFEVAGHVVCWLVAAMVSTYACIHVQPIVVAFGTGGTAECDYNCFYEIYALFVSQLIRGWLGLFSIMIGLWLVMRFGVLRPLRRSWNTAYATSSQQWRRDYWDEGNPTLEIKEKLMRMQQQNFEEVAKPLELYLWVFITFFPPAVVLATKYCADHSSIHHVCESGAEMVLAFRSIASCAVYFVDSECRSQLRDWRTLWHKLRTRLVRGVMIVFKCDKTLSTVTTDGVRFASQADHVKLVPTIDQIIEDMDGVNPKADRSSSLMHNSNSQSKSNDDLDAAVMLLPQSTRRRSAVHQIPVLEQEVTLDNKQIGCTQNYHLMPNE
eukprot:m.132127 g.132127  ORF g.132127 m.132127 type:complete len:466 (+) comp29591_c0_seq2:331-1728(+)